MSGTEAVVTVEADILEGIQSAGPENRAAESGGGTSDGWVTIAEAARRLGVSADRVRRRLKAGEFEARQVASRYGPTWEIRLHDLTGWDSASSGAAPTVGPRVASPPRVAPPVADDGPDGDDGSAAAVELVHLVRHQQDQLIQLAGQVGFLQAQLQQAHETIKLLQAPPPDEEGGSAAVTEAPSRATAMAEEVGRLKAELEQAQRRVAEFEALTDDLERERAAAAAEGAARPWWRFW
jgi:hypothetical protein